MTPLEMVIDRLQKPRKSARGFMACCPAHNDKSPSLSIAEGTDGRVLLNCYAGCSYESIMAAIGLSPADGFVGTSSIRKPSRAALLTEVFIVRIFEADPKEEDRARYELALNRIGATNERV